MVVTRVQDRVSVVLSMIFWKLCGHDLKLHLHIYHAMISAKHDKQAQPETRNPISGPVFYHTASSKQTPA